MGKKNKSIDYNTVGVVLGVVGLLVIPLLFGILAVIFGALAKGKGSKKNSALILGLVDIVWGIISIIFNINIFNL